MATKSKSKIKQAIKKVAKKASAGRALYSSDGGKYRTAKKKAPAKKANRPVNKNDDPLNKLAAWLGAGMAKVKERLDFDIPKLVDAKKPASELAHIYGLVRDMTTVAAEALAPLADANSRLGNQMIPEAFELENITTFTTADGYRVTVSKPYRASIKPEKKTEAYEWLRANGLDALIVETVNAGTLSTAIKEMIAEKGVDPPEDIFNAAFVPSTSLTKVKAKTK